MPAGRPSTYDPAYCEAVIEAAREGKSLTAFAADIEVARSTISEWVAHNPEFSVAVSRAKSITASWYEEKQRELIAKGGSSAQATLIVFGLKNMGSDDWRDKQDIELAGTVEHSLDLSSLDADTLAKLAAVKVK